MDDGWIALIDDGLRHVVVINLAAQQLARR